MDLRGMNLTRRRGDVELLRGENLTRSSRGMWSLCAAKTSRGVHGGRGGSGAAEYSRRGRRGR